MKPEHGDEGEPRPAPRSYRIRQGRMGPQLQEVWQLRAEPLSMPAGVWDLPARTLLEIGCGSGDSLVAAAGRFDLAIGVDVHLKGLAAAARRALAADAGQVRLVAGDAVEVLAQQVPPASLAEVHIWFPDPWPKSRHRRRRLIQPMFAELLADRLAPGGTVRLATDVDGYARTMLSVLEGTPDLEPHRPAAGVVPRPGWRPLTRYERVAIEQGRRATELAFTRR